MNRTSYKCLLRSVLALVVAAGIFARGASAEEVQPTVIALFGDSITTGYYNPDDCCSNGSLFEDDVAGGTTTRGAPTLFLQNMLESSPKRSAIVANWGDGGSSSEDGMNRIIKDLNQNTGWYSGKAYYVLIMYGTNDFAIGISASSTNFNTRRMIQDARDNLTVNYTPIIGTLTPRSDRNVTPYNTQIINAANQEGVQYIHHYDQFISEGWTSLIDLETISGKTLRLHPNDAGYTTIAQAWFDQALSSLIEPDPQPVTIIMAPIISLLLDE